MMQVAVMIAALLGSLVFQLQKNSSDLLYFHGNSWSCTTAQEWTWIAVTGLLMLLLHMKPTKRLELPSEQGKSKLFLLFLSVNLLWFSAAISDIQFTFSVVRTLAFLGAKAAWPGLWNLAFVIFPVKRSSEILALSHKDTLFLHMWAGQAIFFWLAVHTVFLSFTYAVNYDYSVRKWMDVMVPSGNLYTEGVVNFMGWLGLAMLLLLWLTSHPWFRKHFYETFSFLHLVTAALFVFFSNLHDYNTIHFIQPAFAAWIAERLVRRVSTLDVSVYHELATISASDGIQSNGGILAISACESSSAEDIPPLICLTMSLPRSWNLYSGTSAFLYLKCPSISSWQLHPFSISVIDPENMTFSVHIKALGDWTTQFVHLMINNLAISSASQYDSRESGLAEMDQPEAASRSQNSAMFDMRIEGPYHSDLGSPMNFDRNCLFVAGGVGLTGLSEVICRRHCRGQTIQLVWILRTIEEMEFLAKDLLDRLHPPRDTTRIMIFITRQKERHRRTQTVKVDQPLLLETICTSHFNGDRVPADSLMTFPTTFEESRGYPSARTMAKVSLLGVAFTFLLARMICCNRTVRDIESGTILHVCSALPRASTSTTCSNSCQGDGASCCTTSICFYCFRGLTVLFMFLLAPMLPFLFAKMHPYGIHAARWLRKSIRFHRASSRHRNCTTPLQAVSTFDDDVRLSCGDEKKHSSAMNDRLSHQHLSVSVINLSHTSIEYRKPVLSEIFADFCASMSNRSENHDLALTHDFSCDESDHDNNNETMEAAVFVCGSKALAESVLYAVDIHNGNGAKSNPSRGAHEPNRIVHLSVWTATGAY